MNRENPIIKALSDLLSYAEREVCTHEETHRGGAIWEICDSCGAMWADDKGGKPKFEWPLAIINARKVFEDQLREDYRAEMSKLEYACIHCGVPETGDPDLDAIIAKGNAYKNCLGKTYDQDLAEAVGAAYTFPYKDIGG